MQPFTKESSDQSYLKLSIDSMQLRNHALFYPKGRRAEDIEIMVYVEYEEEGINESVKRLQGIQLVTSRSGNRQDIMFQPLFKLWDCFYFNPPPSSSKAGLLRLHYQIRNSLQSSYRQQRLCMTNQNSQLPFKSEPISFPLQKVLKQPYVVNELTIDVHSKTPNEVIDKPQSKNYNQSNQRDGVLVINILYLPNIKPNFQIKNVSIKTKAFAKILALLVQEITKQQSSSISNHQFKPPLQQTILPQVLIPLEVADWQHFQNRQSFQNPISLPLILNNNLDQLEFSIAYEIKTKSMIEEQVRQGKQKQGNKKIKNAKAVEQDNKQKQSKKPSVAYQQIKKRKEIRMKRVTIQKLSKQKQPNQEWTKQSYKWQNQQQQFQLQFQFKLSLNLQPQTKQKVQIQEHQNYPQQENYQSTVVFDELRTLSKFNK